MNTIEKAPLRWRKTMRYSHVCLEQCLMSCRREINCDLQAAKQLIGRGHASPTSPCLSTGSLARWAVADKFVRIIPPSRMTEPTTRYTRRYLRQYKKEPPPRLLACDPRRRLPFCSHAPTPSRLSLLSSSHCQCLPTVST